VGRWNEYPRTQRASPHLLHTSWKLRWAGREAEFGTCAQPGTEAASPSTDDAMEAVLCGVSVGDGKMLAEDGLIDGDILAAVVDVQRTIGGDGSFGAGPVSGEGMADAATLATGAGGSIVASHIDVNVLIKGIAHVQPEWREACPKQWTGSCRSGGYLSVVARIVHCQCLRNHGMWIHLATVH
jgi:hypothetical protein